jgi:Ca2+-binding EF-hand superfamily protein
MFLFTDNGSIDYDEFKQFIIDKDILKSLADEVCYEMQDAFNIFDKDGDGFITRAELKKVLTKIGRYLVLYMYSVVFVVI